MNIVLDGDGAFPELAKAKQEGRLVHVSDEMTITALAGGMTSGATSVALIVKLPDGRMVFAETSLRLLLAAADAFRARYGDK
jgi:hypothetical protein